MTPAKQTTKSRKQLEKDIYNHTHEASKDRPSFGSFFDDELFNLAFSYKLEPTIHDWLKQFATNKSVLIIGASHKDVAAVADVTSDVTAIDISELMVKRIKKRFPKIKAKVADAEKLSKLKANYDIVYCRSILHHLQPLESVISSIHSILKPEGILIVATEPGLLHPLAILGRLLTPSNEHTPGEKPYLFSQFNQTLSTYFTPLTVDYHFFGSLGLITLPTKLKFLKPLCRSLLIPTLKLEHFLSKTILKECYWIISSIYKKSTSTN